MTVNLETVPARTPDRTTAEAPWFDLDITIFETDGGLAEIIRRTDDGCGNTCESASPAARSRGPDRANPSRR